METNLKPFCLPTCILGCLNNSDMDVHFARMLQHSQIGVQVKCHVMSMTCLSGHLAALLPSWHALAAITVEQFFNSPSAWRNLYCMPLTREDMTLPWYDTSVSFPLGQVQSRKLADDSRLACQVLYAHTCWIESLANCNVPGNHLEANNLEFVKTCKHSSRVDTRILLFSVLTSFHFQLQVSKFCQARSNTIEGQKMIQALPPSSGMRMQI